MSDNRRAGRLLAEGLVILVSVLAAFFMEGWRDDRELDRELRDELESVMRELERNRELARLEIGALDRVIGAGESVAATLDEAQGQPTVEIPDTLAWLVTGWNVSFTPSLGAVDALLASGRLSRIENEELRLGLAGLRETFEDSFEEEVFAREINVGQVVPLLGETYRLDFSIGNEFFASGGPGRTPQERITAVPLTSRGDVRFPTRLEVRNAIVHRMAWLSSARSEFVSLRPLLDDLIRLVEEEIN